MGKRNFFYLVILTSIIVVISAGCIKFSNDKTAESCKTESDCYLAYSGGSVCPPCDPKDEGYKCVSKGDALKISQKGKEKFDEALCEVCSKRPIELKCECEKGVCKKPRFIKVTQEESKNIAEEFIKNSPTYKFDGFELKFLKGAILKCPYCYELYFEFSSSNAGYGDRTRANLATVITKHTAKIMVQEGDIKSGILDGKWDMIKQTFFKKGNKFQCKTNLDCARDNSKCADGVDPYHVCEEGRCATLTFIRNPCEDRICPKGDWTRKTDTTCFDYKNCAKSGCDDGSDKTKDECIAVGTKSEGCLYTIVKEDRSSCTTGADCVPSGCCHSKSCVNKNYASDCTGVVCTMSCEGPLDCGAGSCDCVDGTCSVVKSGERI